MRGLLAWLLVFWVVALPLIAWIIGHDYPTSAKGWATQVLITIVAWTLANKAQRAVDARGRR